MNIDINAFKNNYLVAGLEEADIRRVAELATLRIARGGEEIIRLGSTNPDLFVVMEGVAMVYREGSVLLGERGQGSVIGEIALVDNHPRSAYVVAKGNLTAAQFDGAQLRRFMTQNRDIGFVMLSNLSRVLSMRLREASATIEDLQGIRADQWKFAG